MINFDGNMLVSLLYEKSLHVSSLLLILFMIVVSFFTYNGDTPLRSYSLFHYVFLSSACALCIILWSANRRIIRTPKGNIGYLIAIATYNDKEEHALRQNLIHTLTELFASSTSKYPFRVIILQAYYCNVLLRNERSPKYYAAKAKAHFILHGSTRLVTIKGAQHYVIDIQGLIRHHTLEEHSKSELKKDFIELMPIRFSFSEDDTFVGFELTAENIAFVSRYIIAFTAGLSGDYEYCRDLFEELLNTHLTDKASRITERKVLSRIPSRLSSLYLSMASTSFAEWRDIHDTTNLDVIEKYVNRAVELTGQSTTSNNIYSILYYLRGNRSEAMRYARANRSEYDQTWRINLAFLYAMGGDTNNARKQYIVASRGPYTESIPNQVEQFMMWEVERHPEKYVIYYCTGVINAMFKGDPQQAKDDLQRFLEKCPINEHLDARKHAKSLLIDIDESIQIMNE